MLTATVTVILTFWHSDSSLSPCLSVRNECPRPVSQTNSETHISAPFLKHRMKTEYQSHFSKSSTTGAFMPRLICSRCRAPQLPHRQEQALPGPISAAPCDEIISNLDANKGYEWTEQSHS